MAATADGTCFLYRRRWWRSNQCEMYPHKQEVTTCVRQPRQGRMDRCVLLQAQAGPDVCCCRQRMQSPVCYCKQRMQGLTCMPAQGGVLSQSVTTSMCSQQGRMQVSSKVPASAERVALGCAGTGATSCVKPLCAPCGSLPAGTLNHKTLPLT
jgi:hypothetical protein